MAMAKEQDKQATPERWSAKAKTEVILRLSRGGVSSLLPGVEKREGLIRR